MRQGAIQHQHQQPKYTTLFSQQQLGLLDLKPLVQGN